MIKALFALPFFTAFLVAAAPAQTVATRPSLVPPAEVAADPANRLTLELSNGGKVVILLRPDLAPAHVERIQTLVSRGFYNGVAFHRVIPGFMAQGGDPTGTGEGGSALPDLKAEFTPVPHLRGTVSAARTADSRDTANSQFFIMFSPNVSLDNKYTVFGRVIEGMAAVDGIAPGEPPAQPTRIVRASLAGPAPAAAAAAPAEGSEPQPAAAEAAAPPAAEAPAAPATVEAAAPPPAAAETAESSPAPADGVAPPPAAADELAPAPADAAARETPAPASAEPTSEPAASAATPTNQPAPAPAVEPAPAEPAPAAVPEGAADELAPTPSPEPTAQGAPTPQ